MSLELTSLLSNVIAGTHNKLLNCLNGAEGSDMTSVDPCLADTIYGVKLRMLTGPRSDSTPKTEPCVVNIVA